MYDNVDIFLKMRHWVRLKKRGHFPYKTVGHQTIIKINNCSILK